MGKRRIERALDELEDQVLSELTPEERIRLMLEAVAQGKGEWVTRLRESCPRHEYESFDVEYTNRIQRALIMAHRAVYDLHTRWLTFEWTMSVRTHTALLDHLTDLEPPSMRGEEFNSDLNPLDILAELYVDYHAYERFATEQFGVSLDTWLSLHSDGPDVVNIVAETLEMHEFLLEVSEENLNEARDPADDDYLELDDFTEIVSEDLLEIWDYGL